LSVAEIYVTHHNDLVPRGVYYKQGTPPEYKCSDAITDQNGVVAIMYKLYINHGSEAVQREERDKDIGELDQVFKQMNSLIKSYQHPPEELFAIDAWSQLASFSGQQYEVLTWVISFLNYTYLVK
jgi:hypothetical protein